MSLGEYKGNLSKVSYLSPEVVSGESYSLTKADAWACGICLYFMLIGKPPFGGKNYNQTVTAILSGKFTLPSFISPMARSLLVKLLQVDPRQRPSASQILTHPWLQKGIGHTSTSLRSLSGLGSTGNTNRKLEMNVAKRQEWTLENTRRFFSNVLNDHLRAHWVYGTYQFAKTAKSTLENVLFRYSVLYICRRGNCSTLWEYDCAVPSLGISFDIRLIGFEGGKYSGKLSLMAERRCGAYATYVRRVLLIAKAWHTGLPKSNSKEVAVSAPSATVRGFEKLLNSSKTRLSSKSLVFRSGKLRR